MTLTTHQFIMLLIQGFWPLLLIGLIGTSLILKDMVHKLRHKDKHYKVWR